MPSPQFLQLPAEKQQEIIEASLAEFAEQGYDLASTNRIVQRAGISKGVLFKYFRDKEALFLYICEVTMRDYLDTMPREPADSLLTFIQRTTVHKMQFMRQSPLTYRLLIRVTKEPRHPVYAKVLETQHQMVHDMGRMLETTLPQGQLRPGVTWRHAVELMSWLAAGLQEKFLDGLPDVVDENLEQAYQPMIAEFEILLDILKHGIYKGESKQ